MYELTSPLLIFVARMLGYIANFSPIPACTPKMFPDIATHITGLVTILGLLFTWLPSITAPRVSTTDSIKRLIGEYEATIENTDAGIRTTYNSNSNGPARRNLAKLRKVHGELIRLRSLTKPEEYHYKMRKWLLILLSCAVLLKTADTLQISLGNCRWTISVAAICATVPLLVWLLYAARTYNDINRLEERYGNLRAKYGSMRKILDRLKW